MLRLLIVDDEPVIADAMHDIISDVEELDLDLYRAASGDEAISWMLRTKIDILLLDISMPGMTGLEVQRHALEIWPRCRVIFLTGHNDFDFIQSAMRNSGCDYILKTEPEEIVIEAVKKAVREIESETERDKLLESAQKSFSMAKPVLQSKCLSDIIEGVTCDPEEIRTLFTEFHVSLDAEQPVLLMMARVDKWPQGLGNPKKMQMVYSMQDIAREHLQEEASVVSVVYDRNSVIWFVQPLPAAQDPGQSGVRTADWDRTRRVLHGSMELTQTCCRRLYDIAVSIVACRNPVGWEKVALKCEALSRAIEESSLIVHETLLIENDAEEEQTDASSIQEAFTMRSQVRRIDALKLHLEKGEEAEFLRLLDQLMECGLKSKLYSFDMSTEIFYLISAMFLSSLSRWKIADLVGYNVDLEKLKNMSAFKNWEEIAAYFAQLAKCIFNYRENEGLRNANRIFGFIKTYVDQNLAGDLSLTKFAELLNFHPFYLSRLFRQVTGKTLTDYISGEKVKKAKELLDNSHLKIHEIAASLGFETASYFIRFFKKHTGATPQEHRNMQGGKSGV